MTFFKQHLNAINVTCRVLLALFGGFLLSNLVAILIASGLYDNEVDGIVTGLMVSFLVYTVVVMFVFATKTLARATFGVGIACLTTYGITHSLYSMVNP